MLTAERRRAIADRIRQQSSVQLRELSERFQVSDSTIRRDLEHLERQGLLKRTYGGAVLAEREQGAGGPFRDQAAAGGQASAPSDEAARIGAAAADQVSQGDTIYLGSGALSLCVARQLAARTGITVITNALDVASYLAHHSTLPVILTGGQLERPAGALIGHLAELALEELRADRAILGVAGISPDGITGESLSTAQFTRTVIERMPEVIVIADEHKWGRVGPAFLAPLEAIDVIVTSQHAPPAMVWDLSQLGIQIIQARA